MAQIKIAEYTFDNSVGDVVLYITPTAIVGVNEDVVNGNITTRTIYIDDSTMPTELRFNQGGGGFNLSLLTVEYLNIDSNITTLDMCFYRCQKLQRVNTSNWNTSNVTNFARFCDECSSLTEIDVSHFNVGKANGSFYKMFSGVKAEVLDVSKWNVNTTDGSLSNMFNGCSNVKKLDLSNWKVKIVHTTGTDTCIASMFSNCSSLEYLDLSGFDFSEMNASMASMFANCSSLREIKGIENLNISSVTSFGSMFYKCSSLTKLDLRNWVTSSTTSFQSMFSGCTNLEVLRVDNFDCQGGGTSLNSMFESCTKLKQIFLPKLTNKGLGNFNSFCSGCSSLEYISMPNFVWGNCTSINGTFSKCKSLKMLDLTTLDSSTFSNKAYGISGIIGWDMTCPVYYNSNTCSSTDFTDIPNRTNLIDVQGRLMAVYDFNNSETGTNIPTLTGSTITTTIDTQGSESYITHRVIGVDVMPTAIQFGGTVTGLLNVDYLAVTNSCTNLNGLFNNCNRLESLNNFGWDVSNVTNMSYAFASVRLTQIDMSEWNFKNQVDTGIMFQNSSFEELVFPAMKFGSFWSTFDNCTNLKKLDLSKVDTSGIQPTGMSFAFRYCTSLSELDLSMLKLSQMGTSTNQTFEGWTSDQIVYVHDTDFQLDVSSYNATFVRRLSTLFARYTFDNSIGDCLPTITGITTSDYKVNDIVNDTITTRLLSTDSNKVITKISFGSLGKTSSLLALDYLKIDKNITQMNDMFQVCSNVTSINAENWDTSNVTNMAYMLQRCDKLTEVKGLGTWDTSKVTAMDAMFQNKAGNIKEIENWDVSSCKNFSYMFANGGINSELNLSNWQPNNLENCQNMFANSSFTSINLSGWDVPKLNNMSSMFAGAGVNSKLISVNMSNWTMETPANMNSMFYNNSNLTSIDFTGSKVVSSNLQQTFQSCTKLTSLDVSGFDTSQCTNMANMFQNCSSLTSLDLSSWDVSQCTNMANTFTDCNSLVSLDLSHFDTSSVTNLDQTFRNMTSLQTLNVSGWDTSKVTVMAYGFSNCKKLKELDLSSFVFNSNCNCNYLLHTMSSLEVLDFSNYSTPKVGNYLLSDTKLKTIGMLYSSAESINEFTSKLLLGDTSTTDPYDMTNGLTIYYYDADATQLTPVEGVTFKKYQVPTTIQLPPHIQLHSLPDGTRDEVDIKTGILTQRVAFLDLSTIETWVKYSMNNMIFTGNLPLEGKTPSGPFAATGVVSNPYYENTGWHTAVIYGGNATKPYIAINATSVALNFRTTEFTTPQEMLAYQPVSICYELAEPVTTKLILNYNNSCDYGRILPTGMCDKYDVVNSMYTQTMTSILLDGANTWDAMEEMTNVVKFTATGTTVGIEELNMLGSGGLYCDNDLFPNINDDSDVEHCRVDEAGNKFYIYISKDRLMSPDLIGYQIWLQENNFNLIYELAEHLTYVKPYEELDATQARWEGMDCMRDGAINYHANSSDNITMYPTLEYVAPSINNFEVTMLEPNTDYTIYAEGINTNDTINLGGTDINFNNGTLYTSGDNQWLRIDNNDSFYNMVITKGDTTGEVVPYFEGMTSVENPSVKSYGGKNLMPINSFTPVKYSGAYVNHKVCDIKLKPNTTYTFSNKFYETSNMVKLLIFDIYDTQMVTLTGNTYATFTTNTNEDYWVCIYNHDNANKIIEEIQLEEGSVMTNFEPYGDSTVSYTDLKLRSLPNGVKDTINVVTGEYVQRVGEVTFDGTLNGDYTFATDTSLDIVTIRLPRINDIIDTGANIVGLLSDKYMSVTSKQPNNIICYSRRITIIKPLSELELYNSTEKIKAFLQQNPFTVQYELAEPITTKLDPQTLLAYTDGTINLSSDTGLLPTTHYSVPSTNTFNLASMKTGTRYTLKYPSASGSINIGNISYKITSSSMLFMTPLTISGDKSAIVFTDENPQEVVLIEGDYSKREVPFFEGLRSSENIVLTTTDGESTTSVETNTTLRSLPNGLSDKLDLVSGQLIRVAGLRDYQEGDFENSEVYTDGFKTVYPLPVPTETTLKLTKPQGYVDGTIELTSDALIPTLHYRLPSSNNYVLDLLKPETQYTLYANYELDGSFTLGGTTTQTTGNAKVISTAETLTDTNLTFNGDLGVSNIMLVEGDSTEVTTPHFNGLLSVENATITLTGSATEVNRLVVPDTVKLRSIGTIIDELDLITGVYTKRIESVELTGSENWQLGTHQSTDYLSFRMSRSDLNTATLTNIRCDRFNPLAWTTLTDKTFEFITGNGTIEINIRKDRLTTPDTNGFKRWLKKNPTIVHYELKTPTMTTLNLSWSIKPVSAFFGSTTVQSTGSQTLKPYLQAIIPVTSLEEIVASLKDKNAALEEENLSTMLAVTEIFEMMMYIMPMESTTLNIEAPTGLNNKMSKGGFQMVEVYATLIIKGKKTLEDVPVIIRTQVKALLIELGALEG